MTDAQLIEAILHGERDRFTDLVDRYIPLVRGICMSQVFDPWAQDDLIQDSFLESFGKLKTLRDRSRFGPWLATITRNKCRDWLRRQKRHAETLETMRREPAAAHADQLGELTRRELCDWVRDTIAELPEKTRETMLLCYSEGLSTTEAADLLGVKPNTVKQRLHYGREAIGGKLLNDLQNRAMLEDDNARLRGTIASALPLRVVEEPTPRRTILWTGTVVIPIVLAVLAWSRLDGAAPALAPNSTASLILSTEPLAYEYGRDTVPESAPSDGPADASGIRFRLAPQQFFAHQLRERLEEFGIDAQYHESLAVMLTDPQRWQSFLAETADPAEAEALMNAAEQINALARAMSQEELAAQYRSFLPSPRDDEWRHYDANAAGRVQIGGLDAGLYVAVVTSPQSPIASGTEEPVLGQHRMVFRLNAGETTSIRLAPHPK